MTESSGTTSTLLPSSTPIRISGGGSFHGVHGSGLGGESSPVAGTGPHSSSVPTPGLAMAQVPLQLPPSVQTGTAAKPPTVSTGGSSSTPPSSAGLRQVGVTSWTTDGRDNRDSQAEKTPPDSSKLNRKESYKAQRQNYRREKKRVALELVNSLQDPAVILLADWLKIRGTLKSWTKLWCVLKPGLLLIYKSPKTKSGHWVGTVMLNSCQVIERPSKKDGFCFKVFHPLEQTIWATRGPDRETIGAVVQPLPTAYLIFRAPSQAAGKCWMDALELSLRCSALLLRSSSNSSALQSTSTINDVGQSTHETQWSEADYEKHFNENDFDADSQNEGGGAAAIIMSPESESDSEVAEAELHQKQQKQLEQQHEQLRRNSEQQLEETPYVATDEDDFLQQTGEQVEELAEENKSLIWMILKQVRPGMDLSMVVLPTFILEPRSFLDKLSDSYYHADILSNAVIEDDPLNRMKLVVKWYLSSFYKRPKGLKKPYNPILGEVFRCYWQHQNGSRTFFIAEQVSHHPPISAFYVTNREDGFCISCSIVAKSKFYGNSTSAVLEGVATLTLLPRGESYTMTTPYAHCKGILMGKLSMELGGKVNIECEKTGYKADIEFKLKPFLGGNESTNMVAGKIKLGKALLATISGYWDGKMMFHDTKTNEESVLFAVDEDFIDSRLTRYVVPLEEQQIHESQRLWYLVSEAIKADDQEKATAEKTVLEKNQRMLATERKENFIDWVPKLFHPDLITDQWVYKHADMRPWDRRNDLKQYESGFLVLTEKRTQLKAPMIRAGSVVLPRGKVIRKSKTDEHMSDSSMSDERPPAVTSKPFQQLTLAIEITNKTLESHTRQLAMINKKLDRALYRSPNEILKKQISQSSAFSMSHSVPQSTAILWMLYVLLALFVALILKWILKNA